MTVQALTRTLPAVTLVLIRNADVYAPHPLGTQHLLIGGGRILWMGAEALDLPVPLRTVSKIIDAAGRRVIPGLIDGHVHVTGGGGEAGFRTRVPAVPLSRFTTSGVTTVIGLLGTDDVARGPGELLATIYALREEGLNAYGYAGGYHVPPATLTGSVRGDLVFIEALIGIGEVAISDHRSSQPTLDELLRIASECHVAGVMTGKAGVLHLHLGDGSRGLALVREALATSELPARVFNPTHVNRRRALFAEAVELARHGSTIDITAFPVAADEDAYPAAEALERYLAAGAPADRVTISSDAGGCLPCFDAEGRVTHMDVGSAGALLATLHEALARGIALETALPAVTSNPARLLRLARKGTISIESDADLVVLDEQHAVQTVLVRGEFHVQDGNPVRRGTFE
ncbi:MAG TPA: beta-aspartyl-peptidase [Steroidobacteraceae bacterium]|nr:beta-aspartyl-peptidase [Steroidobacteraceae bacterium]